jgi:hypothetical protein
VYVGYKHGAKASNARPAVPADAGIHDSRRTQFEQLCREGLRRDIAGWGKTGDVLFRSRGISQIVELCAEVGKKIEIIGGVLFLPFSFLQPQLTVIGDFILRGSQLERGIPGAAICGVEARSAGCGMAERSVDDAVGRDAENQFPFIDTGREARLGKQAVIGRVVEFEDAFKSVIVIGKAREDGDAAVSVLGGDEAMGIAAVDETGGEQELPSAAAAVEQAAHTEHAGHSGASQDL